MQRRKSLGDGRGQSKKPIAVLPIGDKVTYAALLEDAKEEDSQALKDQKTLAQLTMRARVELECGEKGGKKEIYINRTTGEPSASFSLTAKNFAAAILRAGDIETIPKAFEAAPGERSTGNPSRHAERYALGHGINQLIDSGWKPINQGKNITKLSIPPQLGELEKFKEALKDVTISLFTEKSFCDTRSKLPPGEKNCNIILEPIFSEEGKNIYYAIKFGDNEKEIRDARGKYYKNNNYDDQNNFLDKYENLKNEIIQDPQLKISIVGGVVNRKIITKPLNICSSGKTVVTPSQEKITNKIIVPKHMMSALPEEKKTQEITLAEKAASSSKKIRIDETVENIATKKPKKDLRSAPYGKRKREIEPTEAISLTKQPVSKKQRKNPVPSQKTTITSEATKNITGKKTKKETTQGKQSQQQKRLREQLVAEQSIVKKQKIQNTKQTTQEEQAPSTVKPNQKEASQYGVQGFKFTLLSQPSTTTSQFATHMSTQQNTFLAQVQQPAISKNTKKLSSKGGPRHSKK